MIAGFDPAPRRDVMVTVSTERGTLTGMIGPLWDRWVSRLEAWLKSAVAVVGSVSLTGQGAAITSTVLGTTPLKAGLYRVSWYLRVTQAATTSSSATVSVSWTDGVACLTSGAAVTGNTTATTQSGSVMVRVDNGSRIMYAVAYASVGATPMQFSLDLRVEELT